jgi:hypothetical protein
MNFRCLFLLLCSYYYLLQLFNVKLQVDYKYLFVFVLYSILDIGTTVQSTCFKDMSIFKSNLPHVIQKKGDLVCVDQERS